MLFPATLESPRATPAGRHRSPTPIRYERVLALCISGWRAGPRVAAGWFAPSLDAALRMAPRLAPETQPCAALFVSAAETGGPRSGRASGDRTGSLTPAGKAEFRPAASHISVRAALARIHACIRRAWLVAACLRALQAGLFAGLVMALAVFWQGWSPMVVPLAVLATTAILFSIAARRQPDMDATARYLDRKLGLKEALATALDLESAGRRSSLSLLQRQAAADLAGTIAARQITTPSVTIGAWAISTLLLCTTAAVLLVPHADQATVRMAAMAGRQPANPAATFPSTAAVATSSSIVVRVAVVGTTRDTAAPGRRAVRPSGAQRATVIRSASKAQPAGRQSATTGSTGKSGTAGTVKGQTPGSGAQRTLPFLQGSQSFLPTSPSASGRAGTVLPGSQARPAGASAGTRGSASGAATGTGAAARSSTAKPTGKSAGQNGQGSASHAGGLAGKQGNGAASTGQCLYGCLQITKAQLATPGLITGKGQFSGSGTPGGSTAGHSAGSAPKSGSAVASSSPKGRQLNLTSPYNASQSGSSSSSQANGHNGAGSAKQSVVSAGAAVAQSFQYVPPDANLRQPGDASLVARYFRHGSAA